MPAGDVLDNGVLKLEIVRVLPEALEMRATYRPGSPPPPLHYHPHQEETFEVQRGALRFRVGDVDRTVRAGEQVVVAKGVAHQAQNASAAEEAVVSWITRPALRTERFFAAMYAAGAAGRGGNLLQRALLMRTFAEEFVLAAPPRLVQTCVFGLLAPLARALGYRA